MDNKTFIIVILCVAFFLSLLYIINLNAKISDNYTDSAIKYRELRELNEKIDECVLDRLWAIQTCVRNCHTLECCYGCNIKYLVSRTVGQCGN